MSTVDGRSPVISRVVRSVAAGALAVGLSLALVGCSYTGDDAAADELDRVQQSLVNELRQWQRGSDPTALARWAANDSHPFAQPGSGNTSVPDFAVAVEPLDWRVDDEGDGVLELRIRVEAEAFSTSSVFGRRYEAGSAERCVRIVLDSPAAVDNIRCAGRAPKPVPAYVPPPPLGQPAVVTLTRAMRQPSFERARTAAEEAFPAPSYVVDAKVIEGTWAVVVTRPEEYACIGGTRTPSGKITVSYPNRRQMYPGEGGCSPDAFVEPR